MPFFRRLLNEAKPFWHYLLITAVAIIALTGLDLIAPQLVRQMLSYLETDGMLTMENLLICSRLFSASWLVICLMSVLGN